MSGIIGGAGSKSGVIGTTELDYEEGTWTPSFSGGSASGFQTVAHYTKIGNRVFYNWYSSDFTMSGAGGTAIISGLPFTASAIDYNYPLFTYVHGNAVDGSSTGGYVSVDSVNLIFVDAGGTSGATWINGSTRNLMISGNYMIKK